MKSRPALSAFFPAGIVALFLPAVALSPDRAMAGGLEINLNFEVAPPPPTETVVVEHGAPAHEVVVQAEPPPPLRHEINSGPPPSPHHVWIPGYRKHDGHAYVWEAGRREKPPREGFVWVVPRWEARDGGWVFVEGHWNR